MKEEDMNSPKENTFGARLILARKMAGMSLQDLANALENKVTKQSLNKYELGLMKPTGELLSLLSKVLSVKPDFFLRKGIVELGEISFRKRTDLLKKDEEAVVEKARDYVERYLEIEAILGQDQKFDNPIKLRNIHTKEQVEEAARQLREIWELGSNPIPNLVEMLELRGIKVFLVDDVDQIDGFATITGNGIPLVVVNVKDKSIERIRFTTIHELAHLLLHFTEEVAADKRQIEILCHCFASCFLIPSEKLKAMLGGQKRTYIAIKELIAIKEYYGISIRAILHRLAELEVITDTYYKRWVIYLSKTYGHKVEPGSYKGDEKIKIFEQLINRALSEGIISMSKAAALCNVNINQLRKDFISVN